MPFAAENDDGFCCEAERSITASDERRSTAAADIAAAFARGEIEAEEGEEEGGGEEEEGKGKGKGEGEGENDKKKCAPKGIDLSKLRTVGGGRCRGALAAAAAKRERERDAERGSASLRVDIKLHAQRRKMWEFLQAACERGLGERKGQARQTIIT